MQTIERFTYFTIHTAGIVIIVKAEQLWVMYIEPIEKGMHSGKYE